MLNFMLGFVILVLALICIRNYIMMLILFYYMAEKGIEPSKKDLQRCQKAVVNHILKSLGI